MTMVTQGGSSFCVSLGRNQLMLHSMLATSNHQYDDGDDDEVVVVVDVVDDDDKYFDGTI